MIHIKELILKNFRCYTEYKENFSKNVNVIVGPNASGKTSLIEAIYVLGLGKSFKAQSDREMINYHQKFLFIKGIFNPNDEITISVSEQGKKIKRNGQEYRQLSQHIGYFNVVMFTPEDLNLIKGGPSNRRLFMDINISQYDKFYLDALIKYKQLLKQRNEILKGLHNKYNIDILNIITQQLIEVAYKIITIREIFLRELSNYANFKLQTMSNNQECLKIVYKPSGNVENLWKTYEERMDYDILSKTTTWGPHRDEFIVYVNNKEIGTYGSQGQQRSVSLSLKLGFAMMLDQMEKPVIIILDDVFSELDDTRQNQIFSLINKNHQIFITTTSVSSLNDEIIQNCKLIKLARDGE